MKVKELIVKAPKARNQELHRVLGATKGGPMRDKKKEAERGKLKHKAKIYEDEDLQEGRRHVYGPGDETLTSHPNKTMQSIGKGEEVKVMTASGIAKIAKVQFYNGGTMYKLDREVKLPDGSMSAWVSDREVSLDLKKGAAPDAKEFARKHASGAKA